jgi:AcrR family transcriptional regulator
MAGAQGRPRQTSLDHIIEAALEDGLGTFSMPSVGSRLGIAPSGIYRYVRGRQHLLELALERVVNRAPWPPPTMPWRQQLVAIGECFWWMCDTYEGCAPAIHATPSLVDHLRTRLSANAHGLHEQGIPMDEAWSAIELIGSHAVNSAILAEQRVAPKGAHDAIRPLAPRGRYPHNIEVYLDGLASRLDEDSRQA